MCGRFTLFDSSEFLSRALGIPETIDLAPRYNIAPSQPILAVRTSPETGKREFAWLRWGLIPNWAKDPAIGYRMINARAETIAEKAAYRDAFRLRRCLVPASGFYEWKKEERRKQPYYIRRKDGRPFAIAGLWERWRGPEESPVESCVLITTEPNELVSPLHDRMPAMVLPDDYDLWLDPGISDRDRLIPLLRSYLEQELEAFAVDSAVNNPNFEDPRCIVPAASWG